MNLLDVSWVFVLTSPLYLVKKLESPAVQHDHLLSRLSEILTGTLSLESWKNTFHGIQLFMVSKNLNIMKYQIPYYFWGDKLFLGWHTKIWQVCHPKHLVHWVHWSDLNISQPNAEVPWSHRKPPDDWTATRWYALVYRPHDTKAGSQHMAKAILIVQSQFWWNDSDQIHMLTGQALQMVDNMYMLQSLRILGLHSQNSSTNPEDPQCTSIQVLHWFFRSSISWISTCAKLQMCLWTTLRTLDPTIPYGPLWEQKSQHFWSQNSSESKEAPQWPQ